jgi:integrase
MTSAFQASVRGEAAQPEYLDISHYDRNPDLTEAERAVLQDITSRTHGRYYESIERLWHPLYDALDSLNLQGVSRTTKSRLSAESKRRLYQGIRKTIVFQTFERQRSLWAWTESEWLEFLGANGRSEGHRGGTYMLAAAYVLGRIGEFALSSQAEKPNVVARVIYGVDAVEACLQRVRSAVEGAGWGTLSFSCVEIALSRVMLANGSSRLEDIELPLLEKLRYGVSRLRRSGLHVLSQVLFNLGILPRPLDPGAGTLLRYGSSEGVAPEWVEWCQRWREHSTMSSKKVIYRILIRVGHWLADEHPGVTSPEQWDTRLAVKYIAAVDKLRGGDWDGAEMVNPAKLGKPLRARAKSQLIYVMRRFLQDCQDWEWIPVRLTPLRALATPRAIQNLIGPDPMVIDRAVWSKLFTAGLNLDEDDLMQPKASGRFYPVEMIRALAAVWLFAGLRSDEIRRLRVGCVRWQRRDVTREKEGEKSQDERICFLHVPVNKTSTAFTKPVHPIVGDRIEAWQRARPSGQRPALDKKTGEEVHFLFSSRNANLGSSYLNRTLIPMLCRKAGVPESDSRGRITAHRARATIASQLYNGPVRWSLQELSAWMGHSELGSTQHYAKVSPTKLADKYRESAVLEHNVAYVEALLDVESLRNGGGETALYYELGHGLCANPEWDKCEYRMACVRCPFYVPGDEAQYMRAKTGIRHMLQTVSLTDEEKRAAEGDEEALDRLLSTDSEAPIPANHQAPGRRIVPLTRKPSEEGGF